MALSTAIRISVVCQETNVLDQGTGLMTHRIEANYDWASGTGADQADLVFSDERLLTATSEELDLAGVLSSAFGATITNARVKAIVIRNTHASSSLAVGGAAATQFVAPFGAVTDEINVAPGGVLVLVAPKAAAYVCTGGSLDKFKIDAGAATITYEILIIGASA